MCGVFVGVKLCVFQLFVELLPLPDRVSVVLYVIDQQSRKGKASEALDVSADWSIHHQKISDGRLLEDCIEDGSSSLRVTQHSEVVLIPQSHQYFLEHLERKGLDRLFAALRPAVSRTIDSHDVKLLDVRDPNEILMQEIGILIS